MARNYFTARWPGKCYGCKSTIEAGDRTFFVASIEREAVCGELCCGQRDDSELLATPLLATLIETVFIPEDDFTQTDDLLLNRRLVMPRGKSASDMCKKCFQIPASNGVCGCVD